MKSLGQFSLSEAGDSGDKPGYTHISCSSDPVTDYSRSLHCKKVERIQTLGSNWPMGAVKFNQIPVPNVPYPGPRESGVLVSSLFDKKWTALAAVWPLRPASFLTCLESGSREQATF